MKRDEIYIRVVCAEARGGPALSGAPSSAARGGWPRSAHLCGMRQFAGPRRKVRCLRPNRARPRCFEPRGRGRAPAATWPSREPDTTCPTCGARDRQLLVGARNATLGSQVVEQSWASGFNDDKKLIAFSDSVQDAAHRAGFFGARTYANTVRTALAKAIDQLRNAVL